MRRIAFRSVWSHKLRILLTVVAIVLSVSFITGTLIFGDTLSKVFDDLFEEANEEVDAQVQSTELFSNDFGGSARAPLPVELVDEIRAIDDVAEAEPYVSLLGGGSVNRLLDKEGELLGVNAGPPTILENWIESDRLNAYNIEEGRPPEADDELALNVAAVEDGEFEVGDRITVLTAEGRRDYELVGTFRFGEAESAAGAITANFTLAEAQRLAGYEGQVQHILVAGEEGMTEEEVVALVEPVVPPGVEVLTGTEAAEQLASDVSEGFQFFEQILLVFGTLSVVVGAFIIANTFSILVAQRTRELALLRAVGASRRQVMWSVLLEGAIIGVVSAVIGLGGGIALTTLVIAIFEAAGSDLPTTNLQIGPGALVWALGVGVGVTLLASIVPAIRATRVPPLAALREVAVDRSGASRTRVVLGVLVFLLSLLLMSAAFTGDGDTDAVPGVAMGVVLTIGAAVILGPLFASRSVRLLGGALPRLRGITGRLAVENAARSPKRTSATASALLVSVFLVGLITVFAESARASIDQEVERGFTGDFVIQGDFGFGPVPFFPTTVAERAAEVDGVTLVSRFGFLETALFDYPNGERSEQFLSIVDENLEQLLEPRMEEGELGDLTDRGIVVDRQVAEDNDIELGDTITVTGPNGNRASLTVEALSDDQLILGFLTIRRSVAEELSSQLFDVQVFGDIEPGRDVATVFADIEEAIADTPGLNVLTADEFAGDLAEQISSFVTFIYAMLALSVIIAVIGVLNTLLLSIFERTREFGLLRAVGMRRSQLKSAVRWEALLISVLGTLVGLSLGLVLTWVLVQSLESFGLVAFAVPIPAMVTIVLIGFVFGLVASLYPARRAARLNVLDAIATE